MREETTTTVSGHKSTVFEVRDKEVHSVLKNLAHQTLAPTGHSLGCVLADKANGTAGISKLSSNLIQETAHKNLVKVSEVFISFSPR